MTDALLITLCAVSLYAIASSVLELVRYEQKHRQRIRFERLRARVVDNR